MVGSENIRANENTGDVSGRINGLREQIDNPETSPEEQARHREELDRLQALRPQNEIVPENIEAERARRIQNDPRSWIQALWDELNRIVSSAFNTGGINSPENDAARYIGAAGEVGRVGTKATAQGAFEVAGAADEVSGNLYAAAMDANERAIADKQAAKASNKAALPAT